MTNTLELKSSILNMMAVTGVIIFILSCASTPEKEDKYKRGPDKRYFTDDIYMTISEPFTTHDTNADGYLDQIEFTQLQLDPAIVKIRKIVSEVKNNPLLFNEVDENGDERITLEELTNTVTPLMPKNF